MTNIAIYGANGKMGRVIHSCVAERNDCKIVGGIDVNTTPYADFKIVENPFDLPVKPDVIIDYSHPSSLETLLSYAKMNGVPIVIATTGYSDEQIAMIHSAAQEIPVFFTFNMSLGINLLIELAKNCQCFGRPIRCEIVEKHHNQKIDAPSGTAIMIADEINSALDDKYQFMYDRHSIRQPRGKNEIGIHTIRGGTIVGEHEVIFAGRDEVISLTHSAASKEVFAVGSVNAALFLNGKQKGLYAMKDLV